MDDPGRPMLRPGWHAVRCDDRHLQLGLDAPTRVVLADSPDVRRLLTALAEPDARWVAPTSPAALRALDDLRAAGLLVTVPGSALEARLAAEHGPSAARRLEARRTARVAVQAPLALAQPVSSLLLAEGVEPVTSAGGVTLVATLGPVDHVGLDALVQDGTPHLVVSGMPTGWEIGPFVAPGRTACMRCVDATRAETHPGRAVVAAQLSRRTDPVPVSPTLRAAALALAVREVVAYVDGDVPSTWSASVLLGTVAAPVVRPWARHPLCGCAWDVVLAEE